MSSKATRALCEYKSGGCRDDLLYSLRGEDIPDKIVDGFFHARDGSPLVLPTLVGEPLNCADVAAALCDREGETAAFMMVLDEELVIFVAHDTSEENHPTLVLHCDRRPIEQAAFDEAEDEGESDEEDDGTFRGKWVAVDSYVLPHTVGCIGGGTGFHIERIAGYMNSFEPDSKGLWNGQQVVAASSIIVTDEYSPSEKICLDPPVFKERHWAAGKQCPPGTKLWCHETVNPRERFQCYSSDACDYEVYVKDVAVLPLESMVRRRPGGRCLFDKLSEKEMEAAEYLRCGLRFAHMLSFHPWVTARAPARALWLIVCPSHICGQGDDSSALQVHLTGRSSCARHYPPRQGALPNHTSPRARAAQPRDRQAVRAPQGPTLWLHLCHLDTRHLLVDCSSALRPPVAPRGANERAGVCRREDI